jgi:EAL domain-containing protein (putative c-di-GMP-specific phosphodiesterase class I)
MSQRAVVPHFQPIVATADETIEGFEVLARSPFLGLESAQALFETASHVQQEVELSQLLREEGVRVGQTLGGSLAFFLNTHPKELGDDRLMGSLRALRESFPELLLTLEIHEAAVTNSTEMSALRDELTTLNIRLAYDDFGAGQTRLLELVEVPPDYLKFDRSLIQEIHKAPGQRQRMLATLSRMVAELGIAALAEGVECFEEARVCHQLGFQLAQGYFFGRPDSAGTWRRKLARDHSESITS